MDKDEIYDLLDRYTRGETSQEEATQLEFWFHRVSATSHYRLTDVRKEQLLAEMRKHIFQQIHPPLGAKISADSQTRLTKATAPRLHPKFLWGKINPLTKYITAAVLLIAVIVSLLWIVRSSDFRGYWAYDAAVDYHQAPDSLGKTAVLTTADGKKLVLDSKIPEKQFQLEQEGMIRQEKGTLIYADNLQTNATDTEQYNSLAVPFRSQFQLILSDGTKVWLNSGSTLRYPSHFKGTERRVELQGEAYFEVAKSKDKRFLVVARHQTIEVMGTKFNVNSYADEPYTQTTLLEGKVKVSYGQQQLILKPNEQAVTQGTGLRKYSANAQSIISWKDGYFFFDNETMEQAMQKIARWYGLEVQYRDPDLRYETIFATLNKYSNVQDVLHIIQRAGVVNFALKGNTIYVNKPL